MSQLRSYVGFGQDVLAAPVPDSYHARLLLASELAARGVVLDVNKDGGVLINGAARQRTKPGEWVVLEDGRARAYAAEYFAHAFSPGAP